LERLEIRTHRLEALISLPDRNDGLVPALDVLNERDRTGTDVGGIDLLFVRPDIDHVCTVLAGAHETVDFACGRIVEGDSFGSLGREPQLAANEGQTMGVR